jgi:hypothetical protein
MRCPDCGKEAPPDTASCCYCGRGFTGPPASIAPRTAGAEKRGRDKTITIAAIIIVLVAILVTLSTVLYFISLSFHGTGPEVPSISIFSDHIENGVKFTFSGVSKPTIWSDISIQLVEGQQHLSWSPKSGALDGGYAMTYEGFKPVMLGSSLRIWCNVTDVQGNGYIDGGDFFAFTTGSSQPFIPYTLYTMTIIWEPAGAKMTSITFEG